MALKSCKHCGGTVDSSASTCPHCGASLGLSDIALLVVLIVLAPVLGWIALFILGLILNIVN